MTTFVGQSLKRKEAPRMTAGRGNYTDDMTLPGMLHMAVVRSPEAHAAIVSIDKSEAEEHSGVVAVFTGEELRGDFASPILMVWDPPGVEIKDPDCWPLQTG